MARGAATEIGGSLADLVERLGGIPLDRIRESPPPGTATEKDVEAALEAADKRLCELVDGVLVEKVMGTREALLAGLILHWFWDYLEENDVGQTFGADGTMRLMPGLVRIPDVSFVSWPRLPPEGLTEKRIADLAPDLAVEVLSPGNTRKEMLRKLKDYFTCGVSVVWLIHPKNETAEAYTAPDKRKKIPKGGVLEAADILPGFSLLLKRLFKRADRRPRGA
jgi:Uma2 family endonuclease